MVEFEIVSERRIGIFSEVVQQYRNDGWKIVGPMQQLNSGLYCIPMERETRKSAARNPKPNQDSPSATEAK